MDETTLERYADAAAAALRLPLADDHRPGVLRYLSLAAGFYALVEAVDLPVDTEPSLAFVAVPPAGASEGGA